MGWSSDQICRLDAILNEVFCEAMDKSLADSTNEAYDAAFEQWMDFCDIFDFEYDIIDDLKAARFCCFLFEYFPSMSGKRISSKLSAVTTKLAQRNSRWKRPRMLSHLIKGLKKMRPSKRKHKKPWSVHHTRLCLKFCVDKRKLSDSAYLVGILLGSGCLMRCSEFAARKKGHKSTLYRDQVVFRLKGRIVNSIETSDVDEATITLTYSKTNQEGHIERVNVPCLCADRTGLFCGTSAVCPVHQLQEYCVSRDSIFGTDRQYPLLVKETGHRISYRNMSDWMHSAIVTINKMAGLTGQDALDPSLYTTHALRVGGTTDRARNGEAAHMIEVQGRWKSKTWKITYMSMDFSDISLLSGKTFRELNLHVVQPFVEGQ